MSKDLPNEVKLKGLTQAIDKVLNAEIRKYDFILVITNKNTKNADCVLSSNVDRAAVVELLEIANKKIN